MILNLIPFPNSESGSGDENNIAHNGDIIRYQSIFDNIKEGICVLDKNRVILDVNRTICEMLDFSEDQLIGKKIEDIVSIDFHREIVDYLSKMDGMRDNRNIEYTKSDNQTICVEVNATKIAGSKKDYIVLVSRDISERRKLQEELIQAQKMEALGTMASGIAHDFSNVLTSILGYADFMLLDEKISEDKDLSSHMNCVLKAAEEGKNLIDRLMQFSRKNGGERRVINLNNEIEEAFMMLEHSVVAGIRIIFNLYPHDIIIKMDKSALHQMLFNLVFNACDALESEGKIVITTRIEKILGDNSKELPIKPGRYAVLSVMDNGPGIPQQLQSRVFDPFFTTKKEGHGTGLGLSTIYRQLRAIGGNIELKSEPKKGSEFILYFPIIDE